MSETLYRKYRPKNFSEVIGQTHIVRTLSNSVRCNRIGQAYLFTGPRGTGKTSLARIFAKTVNCKKLKNSNPCEKCSACKNINSKKSLDIIEIDAASNTGVDNIRELRETVALSPSVLKYKVYIIDEVHMLSGGAFNALLKTLEEPPAHAIFILATTEIHKVPETIISRCQRFDFTRLPIADIIKKLSRIAKTEKIKIEKTALEIIAISAEGGMRDAESILEQIISLDDKNITIKEVEEILGTANQKSVEKIASFIINKDSTAAISEINQLLENGYDLQVFNKSLVNYLRQLMLLKISPELKKHFTYEMTQDKTTELLELSQKMELSQIVSAINFFLEAQGKISASVLPQLPLEIAIIKSTQTLPTTQKLKMESEKLKNNQLSKKETVKDDKQETKPTTDISSPELSAIKQSWRKLLTDIRPYNHSLSALLSNCQIMEMNGNLLTLATPYDFYYERLNDTKNKLTVEEVFSKILKTKIQLEILLNKNLASKKENSLEEKKPSEQDSLLSDAMEIMGGKIVKE